MALIEVKRLEILPRERKLLDKLLGKAARDRLAPIYAAKRNRRLNAQSETDNSWPFESMGGILSYISLPCPTEPFPAAEVAKSEGLMEPQ